MDFEIDELIGSAAAALDGDDWLGDPSDYKDGVVHGIVILIAQLAELEEKHFPLIELAIKGSRG